MKTISKILLANLFLSIGIGILAFFGTRLLPSQGDSVAILIGVSLVVIAAQAFGCWVASLIYFLKRKNDWGLGLLLSGFLVGLVGFGTCSTLLMTF